MPDTAVPPPTDPAGPHRLAVVLSMRPASLADHLLDAALRRRLEEVADLHPEVLTELHTPAARDALSTADVLLTGWGAPPLPDETFAAATRLRAVLHAGGDAWHLLGPDARAANLVVTNSRAANSVPVAEYAQAMIVLAGKQVLPAARRYAAQRRHLDREEHFPHAGNFRRRVGIVGASTTGRLTIELLRPFDLDVVVHDPYLTEDDAAALGVRRADLDDLAAACDVVSIHAPDLPETRHLFDARRLALLPDGSTLINTARGALVDTDALVDELRTGRIDAILDVTDPEPLPPGHPLWSLENALLTPHVAGSMGNELLRLGDAVVSEVERLAAHLAPAQ
ncbi:hydroxyacid dehydrogenase [Isoptericola sp. NPDC057391]|uniref:hydroxyacid dehydrogenase n=1 Tax=Isoptericola sp. NPDC057391 TaxID=3346117 RepID=UPI00363167E5